MEQKTVFISYRRSTSKYLARSIYQSLTMHGWGVFLDVTAIDGGDFDRIILRQIAARAHFILLISSGALERCVNEGDWLRREIEEAVRLDRNIVPILEEGADFNREMSYLPDDDPDHLRTEVSKKNYLPLPYYFFDAAMEALRTRFLKTPEYVQIREAPAADRAEIQRRIAAVEAEAPVDAPSQPAPVVAAEPPVQSPPGPARRSTPARPSSSDLLPAPFEWIEIPGGHGTLKTNNSNVTLSIPTERYWIAKYPVTNAQFELFMKADGYRNDTWWTQAGLKARKEGWHYDNGWKPSGTPWTEPRYWNDGKWKGADQPVVGVSWYESVAFCRWLSETTGEAIMLPTEAQWQYAAQGDDGRTYSWGNNWDCKRCNNSVKPCDSNVTTPVTRYEGKNKGDSPFGVVDMAGNVWEWCLTDYSSGINDADSDAERRVLRGGSWSDVRSGNFRCDYRSRNSPGDWVLSWGFRLSRS